MRENKPQAFGGLAYTLSYLCSWEGRPALLERLGRCTSTPNPPRRRARALKPGAHARLFSLWENSVCEESHRLQCREWPEKPIAQTLTSARALTDNILCRENKRVWARNSCSLHRPCAPRPSVIPNTHCPPELKVRTPAHTKQLGWYVELESRVTQSGHRQQVDRCRLAEPC